MTTKWKWTTFDVELEDAKMAAERQQAQDNAMIDEVVACPHRVHAGFYDIRCEHPDRATHKQCVGLNCPVL